ncbi:hypothetical protein AMTR_s00018p00123430 [Amborella trichopoda]|uniref:WAT1-related protein n=1 Tax=Amborella trichopoda TaxID=13333 RepID=W1PKG8_AMBTC|nr:hypothetical protein AMTR_s00018p00123430 [Amborella trichopoda]
MFSEHKFQLHSLTQAIELSAPKSIIGSILIIGGLYAFLWGRKRSIINKGNNDKEICIQDSQEAVVVGASVPLQIIVAPLIDAEDEGREKQEIVKEKATR